MLAPSRADRLDALAGAFDGVAAAADRTDLPLLLRVDGSLDDPDGATVATKPLHGVHPIDELLGRVAPPEWCALGVAAVGWSLPRDRYEEGVDADRGLLLVRPSEQPDRVPVRSTVLVARDGAVACRLTVGDEPTVDDPPGAGALLDVLLRALEASTPPPAIEIAELLTLTWLAEVVAVAEESRRRLSWERVVELQPTVPDGPSWDLLREQVADGAWPGRFCEPHLAEWFDAGSFARWTVSGHPPLAALLAQAKDVVVPSAFRRLTGVLHRSGVV